MTDILAAIEAREFDVELASRHTDLTRMTPEYIQEARRTLAVLGEPSVALARALVSDMCMDECCKDTPGRQALAAWAQAGEERDRA
jgi:hypothetical protein